MKWIITIMFLFFLGITHGYGQETKKIRVCDNDKLETYFNKCIDGITFSTEREKKYYIGQCRTQAFDVYCAYKWAVITKRDTIFCDETKKRKYLKLCETCDQ